MNMGGILDSSSENVPHSEHEYIGEDGLLHCGVCHRAVQTRVKFLEKEKIVRCICDCQRSEMDAHEERLKQEERQRQRMICFAETNMMNWNFANDDRSKPKLTAVMQNYVKNFTDFRREGKGLLLYGDCGTGKTFFAACIANALLDQGFTVQMTNFARVINQIQGTFQKQEIIDEMNRKSLLIIDDLGAERKSEFMQETVFNIIDARYRSGLPLIITTNLTMPEIQQPQGIGHSRIYDRIIERCVPVKVDGGNRRKKAVVANLEADKRRLGLI